MSICPFLQAYLLLQLSWLKAQVFLGILVVPLDYASSWTKQNLELFVPQREPQRAMVCKIALMILFCIYPQQPRLNIVCLRAPQCFFFCCPCSFSLFLQLSRASQFFLSSSNHHIWAIGIFSMRSYMWYSQNHAWTSLFMPSSWWRLPSTARHPTSFACKPRSTLKPCFSELKSMYKVLNIISFSTW